MKKVALFMSMAMAMTGVVACNNTDGNQEQKQGESSTDESSTEGKSNTDEEGDVPGSYEEGENKEDTSADVEEDTECDPDTDKAVCVNGVPMVCEEWSFLGYSMGAYWTAYDTCTGDTVCKVTRDGSDAQCVTACSDASQDKSTCALDAEYTEYYGEDIFFSSSVACEMATDGKFYLFDKGSALCDHGCNTAKDDCLYLTDDEGEVCDSDTFVERCDDGAVVYCYYGAVTAFTCDTSASCSVAKIDGANYADCALPCEKADEVVTSCTSYQEEYGLDLLSSYVCTTTIDNKLAAFYAGSDYNQYCSDCDKGTCEVTDADKGVNAKVGDSCNYYLFETRCADDSTGTVTCDYDANYNYVVTAEACDSGEKCMVVTSGDYEGALTCLEDAGSDTCDTKTATSNECMEYSGYSYAIQNACFSWSDGYAHSVMIDYTECESSCKNGACVEE